jgi:hypothetical protein
MDEGSGRIEANLKAYLGAREPTGRYTSFDYCHNFFRSHHEDGRVANLADADAVQLACLHLGFYLASWGMLRGSSVLLQRSVKHFAPVVEVIAQSPDAVWTVDADNYGDDASGVLFDVARRIRAAFPEGASDILVTKIMLGVYGCVPAFDTYFKRGFGVWTFGPKALTRVARFYADNAEVIEHHRVPTIDFVTGEPTNRRYSRAKVIDMIFFVEGSL